VPWMPESFAAPTAEARYAQKEAAHTNDAVPFYEGIMADEPDALIRSFAGQPVLDDPRVGRVEGARGLRDFGPKMAGWLRKRYAVAEHVGPHAHPHPHGRGSGAAPTRDTTRPGSSCR
jgi:soluble lytic murein transglycosylase-like protein